MSGSRPIARLITSALSFPTCRAALKALGLAYYLAFPFQPRKAHVKMGTGFILFTVVPRYSLPFQPIPTSKLLHCYRIPSQGQFHFSRTQEDRLRILLGLESSVYLEALKILWMHRDQGL